VADDVPALAVVVEVDVPAPAVVVEVDVPAVAALRPVWFSGWTKTTVSDAVFAVVCTCTSATKPGGRPHGRPPPGTEVPASWVTFPRKRYVSPPVVALTGWATSEPTS